MNQPLHQTELSLPLLCRGKVRDIYVVDDDYLLLVATDRLSAFDVVLPDPIPEKGNILTALSCFWFELTRDIVANHLTGIEPAEVVSAAERDQVAGRALVVRRLDPLPIEAVARGYLIGSGWNDYRASGAVCGIALPAYLELAQQLPQPIFTPATKAAAGDHDENISYQQCVDIVGSKVAEQIRDTTLEIYSTAAAYAAERGIIIADTKFEFALDGDRLVLIDECLTPDSSRFWPADQYRTGISPPSFDKQFVRDYLETLDWDKQPPAPHLPPEIIDQTHENYLEAYRRLVS
ncbi:MAG: phosphoribosylaminoimidazolesuccinocarboxamide synthase [Gammaproteobacteria bacterium]|nr:phosphoribosylaminoimidazolesuccinocarboxamide synthase [Gammaproteobacteria bacterium]NNF60094.1 phosphoribosylaminoimidazolesuccinocarboxamide synthase [Gammaproteobacteria bacterium]NNM19850.1 phosphoribosylaminoimidazolesuccinocarboxamide synthase [Gammaproteobacteria bacterium]